jgi:hypothetical protein
MEKGRGFQRSLYGDSRLSFFSIFLFFFLFSFFLLPPFFELAGTGVEFNDWLEIYEKDRKIIPFSGDSNRERRVKGTAALMFGILMGVLLVSCAL